MASLSLLEQLSGSASGWVLVFLDVAAKGAVILILTSILALTMRRAPAATRHMVWLMGTCSLLVLPVLSATLPGWHILPQWTAGAHGPMPAEFVFPADAGTASAYAAPQAETSTLESPPPARAPAGVAEYRRASTHSAARAWAWTRGISSLSWQAWVLLAWAGGTLILLTIIAGGYLSLRWLEHRSERITDDDWRALLSQLRTQLGIHRPVDMLCSGQRAMPMTWGLWRTRILLPADAENWSLEQRCAVLLHELAHARRWDCLWQLAVQLTCAFYWFNPLIWLSWHCIQTERERACDDLVLRSGTKPSAYAEQLLHIAEEMPATRYSAAAIAMARPGNLEGRLLAILDTTRNRKSLTRLGIALVLALMTMAVFPLAMLRAGAKIGDEGGVMKPGEVPAATRNSDLADRFVADLSQQNLPFLDAPKLDELRSRLRRFVAERIPANLPPHRLQELLAAIDRHVQRCFPKNVDSDTADRLYLAFPDAIMTFQWQLWLAANPQPLTAEQEAQRASQRRWMQDRIRSLPAHRGRSQSDALASLDQLLADPLDPLFATPMDDATFQRFKQAMEKYPAADELPYIVSHIIREALIQRDPTAGSISLPFEQELVGWGHHGTIVELSFASNRAHAGDTRNIRDFEAAREIIDVLTPSVLKVPTDEKSQGDVETWLAKEGRGHLGYDDAKGGGLFAVRGARLLELQAHSWIEADQVSDDHLRQELESGGGHVVSLAAARQRYRQNYRMGLGDCFIGVLTADGKLSVARVEGFGNNDVQLGIRPRTTHPAPSSPPVPGGSSTPDQLTSSPLQSTSATTRPTATTFGPVIERTINLADADAQGLAFFSMARGQSIKPPFPLTLKKPVAEFTPEVVEFTPALWKWVEDVDVNVVIQLRPTAIVWSSLRMQEDFAGQMRDWDRLTPGQIRDIFARKDAQGLVSGDFPNNWAGGDYRGEYWSACQAFRTRSGRVGVLQWMGVQNPQRALKLRYRLIAAATGTSQPEGQSWIELRGQVVDEESGNPIEHYAIQRGFVDPKDASKVSWGGETTSSRWAGGRFQHREGIPRGQVAWFRVLAEGYLPAPITPKPVTAPAMESNLIIRLKKGVERRGQVLDHTGKPVVGALVMLAGHQHLDLTDGKPHANYQGSRATTDADGRFALAGSGAGEPGEHIAVSAASLNVWLAPVGEAGRELTIRLPEPATLTVHYDIEGAEEEALVRVELKTWEMPEWKGALNSVQYLRPRNGNVAVAPNMTPGTYDIARVRKVRIGDGERGDMCDRTTLVLAAGQKGAIDFVRKTGQQVKGTVTGLQGAGIADAAILIRSADATGDPRNTDDWKKTLFDAVGCGADGTFVTSRLSPGRYKAIAEAYKPETPEEQSRSGLRMPALIAMAEFVVPETGVAARIVLELKPRPVDTRPVATHPIAPEEPATADSSSMDVDMPEMVIPAEMAAASWSVDSWIKYQEQRQVWANKSPDGWSEVVHDLRARFVPQAGVIKAGETVTMSIEVENTGTEVREFFWPRVQVPARTVYGLPLLGDEMSWIYASMRQTGGSSPDTRAGRMKDSWRVEPKKNVVVTGSLPYVLLRGGEYRARGKVATENPIRGSNNHREDTWLILPELVLKVDAGDPAATAAHDTCWGEAKDGLRAGLKREYGNRPTPQYAVVGLAMEVENTTDQPVVLTYREGAEQADTLEVRDHPLKGRNIHISWPKPAETVREHRVTLQPHQRLVAGKPSFLIVAPESNGNEYKPWSLFVPPSTPILRVEPGEYSVRATFGYKPEGAEEWSGAVRTGDMSLKIVAGTPKEGNPPRP